MHTYAERLFVDIATGRPLAGIRATLVDAETEAPVQAYRDGAPVTLVSGVHGVIDEFQTEDTTRRVRVTVGSRSLSSWCLEAVGRLGRGIASIADDDGDGLATVTYTDGATSTLILPDGVEGAPGAPGPAPRISIGTVTSGSMASASITGTPPDLTLGLVLPKGDPGAPGALADASSYVLVGPGRPDQPSTTAGTITGAEPAGAEYRSTDGASVGAYAWRKRPGGAWAVTDGDTGPRNVNSIISAAGVTVAQNEPMTIRRINDIIYFESGTLSATTTGYRVIMNYPAGFDKPAPAAPVPLFQPWKDAASYGIINLHAGGIYLRNAANLSPCTGAGAYLTKQAWPSAPLPGTPA